MSIDKLCAYRWPWVLFALHGTACLLIAVCDCGEGYNVQVGCLRWQQAFLSEVFQPLHPTLVQIWAPSLPPLFCCFKFLGCLRFHVSSLCSKPRFWGIWWWFCGNFKIYFSLIIIFNYFFSVKVSGGEMVGERDNEFFFIDFFDWWGLGGEVMVEESTNLNFANFDNLW